MAIVLTGGTGKTSLRIAAFLQEAKVPFVLTSRKDNPKIPAGTQAIKFDWLDPSTFEIPFQHKFNNGETITAIYLVAPEVPEPVAPINAFIDHAIQKHCVKRFVMLAGSTLECGGDMYTGKVWSHLVDLGVEYCIIRATWFMENFSEWQHFTSIRDEGKIYSACADGKIPFISANDIAAVAYRALTDEKPHNCDRRVLGPELLTYDQVAAKFTTGLGREVVHVKYSQDEVVQRLLSIGMGEYYAKFLAWLETTSAAGLEDRMNDTVEKVTGSPPQSFDAWVQENKAKWDK